MKSILVLTDLSEVAYNATFYAYQLASQLQCNLILLYAAQGDPKAIDFPAKEKEIASWPDKLSLPDRTTTGEKPLPQITTLVQSIPLEKAIKALLMTKDIALIVLGATDGKKLPGSLFGNHVKQLVSEAPAPMLVIPENIRYEEVKHLFFVTDIRFNPPKVMQIAVGLAKALQAGFTFLHTANEGMPDLEYQAASTIFKDDLATRFDYPLQYIHNPKEKNPTAVIHELLGNDCSSILAFPLRKYHFFQHIFTNNPEHGALIYKQLPLLIIPDSI